MLNLRFFQNMACPYCGFRFHFWDAHYRCESRSQVCAPVPDEVRAAYLGKGEIMAKKAFHPKKAGLLFLKKMLGRDTNPTCSTCHEQTSTCLCPACHGVLPSRFWEMKVFDIKVLAPTSQQFYAFLSSLRVQLSRSSMENVGLVFVGEGEKENILEFEVLHHRRSFGRADRIALKFTENSIFSDLPQIQKSKFDALLLLLDGNAFLEEDMRKAMKKALSSFTSGMMLEKNKLIKRPVAIAFNHLENIQPLLPYSSLFRQPMNLGGAAGGGAEIQKTSSEVKHLLNILWGTNTMALVYQNFPQAFLTLYSDSLVKQPNALPLRVEGSLIYFLSELDVIAKPLS